MENAGSMMLLTLGGCFFSLFALIGAGLLAGYYWGRKKAQASLSWPHTQGKVLESYVRQDTREDFEDNTTTVVYFPEVRYGYTVNGEEYVGRQISFGGVPGGTRPSLAQKVVDRYPEGAEVTVYYNPDKPSEAVLEHGAPSSALLVIGGILLALGLCPLGLILLAGLKALLQALH